MKDKQIQGCDGLEKFTQLYNNFVVAVIGQLQTLHNKLNALADAVKTTHPDTDFDEVLEISYYKIRLQRLLDLQATAAMSGNLSAAQNIRENMKMIAAEAEQRGCVPMFEDICEKYKPVVDEEMLKFYASAMDDQQFIKI